LLQGQIDGETPMRYHRPTVTDHGSIGGHTFTRCPSAQPTGPDVPPKDWQDYGHDKFGECSSGHALS